MKKIHILESKLDEIRFSSNNNAGTDNPYYEDERGNVYEADWNGTYGFPFGYWPIDYYGNHIFCVGEPYTTHGDACGKAAERYVMDTLEEQVGDASYRLADKFEEFESDFKEYGYHYNEDDDNFVSEDGSEEKDVYDFTEDIVNSLDVYVDVYDYVKYCLEEFLFNNTKLPDSQEIQNYLLENVGEEYDFYTKDGIEEALNSIGVDFYWFFEQGYGQGRVWPGEEMIGFYPSEQPDPERLKRILCDLEEHTSLTVEELLKYMMVFEDWDNDGEVTACTVSDYIDGKYGPNSDEDENDDDTPRQYSNGQKTVFVPHLADQDQKREFFKDFRDTRDRAVYVPRENGAGSLAAYHAMRYPYGENKNKKGETI